MTLYLHNDLSTKCYLLFMHLVIDIKICYILSQNYIYTIKASLNILSHLQVQQIHTVQRIITNIFAVISDSLLEVLAPLLLGTCPIF